LVHGKEPLMNEGHLVASSAMMGAPDTPNEIE